MVRPRPLTFITLVRSRQRTHGAEGVKEPWYYCLARGHVRPAGHASCNVAILIHTTLGNGYLGSRIDEEHSKMRYLVWIAESHEPSSFWTQVAPEAFWLRARMPGRLPKDTPNPSLGTDVVFGSPCLVVQWVEVGAAGVSCRAPACGGRPKLFSVQCLSTQPASWPRGPI